MSDAAKDKRGPAPGISGDVETRSGYQSYFASGTYDRRYPAPNRAMWRRISGMLGPQVRVLDFGCGSGRYLLQLRGLVAQAIGFDVSEAALEKVRHDPRAAGWDGLVVLGPEPGALDAHIARQGPVDLVLCLFGVVGHITDEHARAEALARIAGAVRPGTGRLLISVPNRARRFRSEQRAQAAQDGLIHYTRAVEGAGVHLHYQLFDPARLRRELEAAGLRVRVMGCESVLPESWLLHSALARAVDAILTPLCPARWGYGIFAEAGR